MCQAVDADQAGGRPKCMSGQQFARTRHVPTKAAIPGDMEQADKSIACGTLAKSFVSGPVQSSDGLSHRPCASRHAGCPYRNSAGAAGAVFAQSFRTPLRGKRDKE